MKKAFDQTVRDLKRGVNKKVLKLPGIEQKILDATSNEPWGPHGSHLADLAQATRNYHEFQMIMTVIWKRINDTGKNWRHVYKALTVLEYLVAHGSERIIDEIKEHSYQISTLVDFQYIDSSGRDQGGNVRRKSQSLVALVNNRERIQELREKALSNNDRYRSSTGGAYRPGSYSGPGDYGDRYDDRFGGHYGNRDDDRNGDGRERDQGYRDGEKSARGGDPYNQGGGRYGRDYSERHERDSYRDEEYRGSRGNDDYQFGSRNRRSTDRDTERSLDDYDDRSSSRLSGQNVDAPPTYEEATRESESHIQHERNGGTMEAPVQKESSSCPAKPASLADDTSQSLDQASVGESAASLNKEVAGFDEFDPRGSSSGAPPSAGSPEMDFLGSLSVSDSVNSLAMMPLSSASTPEGDSMNSGPGMNFGPPSTASPVSSQPFEDPFGDAPFKATPQDNFIARPQDVAPVSVLQPSSSATYGAHTLQSETPKPFENPFGDTSFTATQQDSFGAQPQNVAPDSSFQLSSGTSGGAQPLHSEVVKAELSPSFDFGDTLGGLTYTPAIANGQPSPANLASLHLDLPGAQASCDPLYTFQPHTDPSAFVSSHGAQPVAPTYHQTSQSNLFPQSGFSTHAPPAAPIPLQATQPAPSTNIPTDPLNLLPQSGLSATQPPPLSTTTSAGPLTSTQPSKAKFEPKSAVWADTLSRGLVDLNISGPKTNPLADIGVDFDSINRMEKRKEMKSTSTPMTSTITMGKAMGAGSGIGRTGASGLAPPPNPMMGSGMNMGMGMGVGGGVGMGMGGGMGMGMAVYGGNTGQPMGMGMGMNMNMNMNMNMGMGTGTGMGMGMGMGQGALMRPPAGMPLPSPGMPGVGYNPTMGMGGYGSQQPYGGGGYR